MKKLKLVLSLLLAIMLFVTGCADVGGNFPLNPNSTNSSDSSADNEVEQPFEVITVAQALELCGEVGNLTTERYYLSVTIDSVTNPTYGAMMVHDETGSISVYNSKNADGTIGYANMEDKPYAGDTALLYCT
ncbi:MAG: hypothetical protein IKT32_04505, partial [Clostridia bacterium]|nr:hypothetical protein [Clostridia bacterium]